MGESATAEYPDKFWHCRVRKRGNKKVVTVKDMTFADLSEAILEPYRTGRQFPVSGLVVSAADIDEVQIVQTANDYAANAKRFYDELHRANAGSTVVSIAVYPGPFGSEDATDYTHGLLFSANTAAESLLKPRGHGASSGLEVFVVHGRDEALRETVCRFLERLGLKPVVLVEQADKGRTIIEKFEQHSNVRFAVVLLTPDDEGRLRGEKGLAARARQNVIFELGFFYGKLGRQNVCAVLKEGVEFPSDIQGVICTVADSRGAWQLRLAKEMRAAGLNVDFNRLG